MDNHPGSTGGNLSLKIRTSQLFGKGGSKGTKSVISGNSSGSAGFGSTTNSNYNNNKLLISNPKNLLKITTSKPLDYSKE